MEERTRHKIKWALTGVPSLHNEDWIISSADGVGFHAQKTEVRPSPYTIYKDLLKMEYRLKGKT